MLIFNYAKSKNLEMQTPPLWLNKMNAYYEIWNPNDDLTLVSVTPMMSWGTSFSTDKRSKNEEGLGSMLDQSHASSGPSWVVHWQISKYF